MTIADAYQLAFNHHVAGRLKEAESLYRQILQQVPDHAESLHMLGALGIATGHVQAGAELIEGALAINPSILGAWNNLAEAWRALKQNDRAMECYRRAVEQEPHAAEPHNNLGVLYKSMQRPDDAIASFRRAIALRPDYADAQNNLAEALADRGQFQDAIDLYRAAIQTKPGHAEMHNNLGSAMSRLSRLAEAEIEFRRAIELKPDYAEAWNNLATILIRTARYDEADRSLDRAAVLDPNHAPTKWSRAIVQLTRGDFRKGLRGYDERWNVPALPRARTFAQPMWDGSQLNGQTILVHHEQGFGDMIQMARYLPKIAQRGGRVILEIQPELAALMQTVDRVEHVIPAGEPLPAFDVHVPIMSLPRLFDTTLDTIPRDVPYLKPDPARIESFRSKLVGAPQKRVGLTWWGKPLPDPARSIQTELLQPLIEAAAASGVQLISLQRPSSDLPTVPASMRMLDLGLELMNFADTAAAMSLMQLVITIDSAPAHLAGALALPTWVLLPHAADWRWLLDRTDSPWYPTMRLFRRSGSESWVRVIGQVADQLREWSRST